MTPPPPDAVAWDDDDAVARQYATTANLAARAAVWTVPGTGPSAQDLVVEVLRDARARRVLEVGAGRGELAARLARELGASVLALDRSPAMVGVARACGVAALVGDARALPVVTGGFDAVVAAWMLYHVAPLDRALDEFVRVLAPGGALVAVTNGRDHLAALWDLVGAERVGLSFSVENGAEVLATRFADVRRHDVASRAHFADRAAAARYLESTGHADLATRLPALGWPRECRGATSVFLATSPRSPTEG